MEWRRTLSTRVQLTAGVGMPAEFLAKLALTDEERAKLASIGATNALMLVLAQRASPEAFDKLLGPDRAKKVVNSLVGLLTPEEHSRLADSSPSRFALGAHIGPAPKTLPEPRFDINERDRLFREIERLRALPSPSGSQREKITDLTRRLNALLEYR